MRACCMPTVPASAGVGPVTAWLQRSSQETIITTKQHLDGTMPDSVGWLATRFTRSIMDCRRPLGAAEPGICTGATGGFGRPGPLPASHARRIERLISQ